MWPIFIILLLDILNNKGLTGNCNFATFFSSDEIMGLHIYWLAKNSGFSVNNLEHRAIRFSGNIVEC